MSAMAIPKFLQFPVAGGGGFFRAPKFHAPKGGGAATPPGPLNRKLQDVACCVQQTECAVQRPAVGGFMLVVCFPREDWKGPVDVVNSPVDFKGLANMMSEM
eukprot:11551075-Alexandrium_andersonii.AAC.1